MDRRYYAEQEIRAVTSSIDGKIIEGHAAVFGHKTNIDDRFFEVIERGAFDGCNLNDVSLFVNHDRQNLPLARTTSGTMTLSVDDVGLKIRAKLDTENNPDARKLYSVVSRGDVVGMSFAFSVAEDDWQDLNSDMPTRHIKKIKRVIECSICNYPAYDATDVSIRAKRLLEQAREEKFKVKDKEYQRLMQMCDDAFGSPTDAMDERTRAVRSHGAVMAYLEEKESRTEQPPKFIQGKGFISAGERSGRLSEDLAVEQRKRAGELLKENRTVKSPLGIFSEQRTMTLNPPSGEAASIVVPSFTSEKIEPDFPIVSALIDSVAHLSLPGGESFKQPYITGIAPGGYTSEGQDAAGAETSFGFSNINRCKITAYAELTEELEKLPSAAYANVVFQNIRTSMRKLLTQEILRGKGLSDDETQHRLVGIFSDKATAISPDTDLELSQITDTTLDEILCRFGGEEEVETQSCLLLSKLDLLAFSKVRTATQQKFYDIQFTGGNGGTINGVKFIVDSACKPIMSNDTAAGEYCMAYGALSGYLLVEFSPLEIRRSDDFKFRQGVSCFKGSVFCGGNVVKKNAFLRIRKG